MVMLIKPAHWMMKWLLNAFAMLRLHHQGGVGSKSTYYGQLLQ